MKAAIPSNAALRAQPYARLASLDVLRGLALLGIFVVNVQFMAQPTSTALVAPEAGGLNFTLWFFVKALFVSKFVGIFSLLFGVGFALQHSRASQATSEFSRMYVRRSWWLMGIGLVHGVFLFEGDILLPYSIAGFLLLAFRNLSPRGLKLASAICLLCAALSTGLVLSLGPGDWGGDTAGEIAAHLDGDLGDLLLSRGVAYAAWLVLSSVIGFNWRVLSAFFLGSLLLRAGFFERGDKRGQRRFAAWMFSIGLLSEVGLTYLVHADLSVASVAVGEGLHEITSMVLALGYVGVVRYLVNHGAPVAIERLFAWIASAGRTALTNYLLQSVLANLYFTFLGFGWYATLDQAQMLSLVFASFAGQVLLSVWWMKRYRAGPLEWAWRSAIQGQRLPLRR